MSGKYSSPFLEFVTNVGECKTKSEEMLFVEDQLITIKNMVKTKRKTAVEEKEFLVRLLYLEMLGYDCSWAYFEAVKLISQSNVFLKKLGYMFICLYLPRKASMKLLLMQQMKKDLESTNYLIVSMALEGVTNLVSEETLPLFTSSLFALLDHDSSNVRRKCYCTLLSIYEKGHESFFSSSSDTRSVTKVIEKGICDPEISVMGTTLDFVISFLERCDHKEKQLMKKLVPSLVDILAQISEGRLGRESGYFFKNVPVPWVQIKILKIFSGLGKDDQHTSQLMYDILSDVLRKCSKIHETISYAVIVETVLTIIHLYPNPSLLSLADESIRGFLTHRNINMKYFGLSMLCVLLRERTAKSETSRNLVMRYQSLILSFLSSHDETIQRLSLELLVLIANEKNIIVITKRLLAILRETVDDLFAKNIIGHIVSLGERLCPTILWYLKVVNYLYEIAPPSKSVRAAIPYQRVIQIIRAGYLWVSQRKDSRFKAQVVDLYLQNLQDPQKKDFYIRNDGILRISTWVLGEYGHLSIRYPLKEVFSRVCDLLNSLVVEEESTKQWIIWAIRKLLVRNPDMLRVDVEGHKGKDEVLLALGKVLEPVKKSVDLHVFQTGMEYFRADYSVQRKVETEELEVDLQGEYSIDPNLSFLDDFVREHGGESNEESESVRKQVMDDIERSVSNKEGIILQHEGPSHYMLFDEEGGKGGGGSKDDSIDEVREDRLEGVIRAGGGFVWDEEGFKEFKEGEHDLGSTRVEESGSGGGVEEESSFRESGQNWLNKQKMKKKSKKKKKKKKLLSKLFDGLDDNDEDDAVSGFKGGHLIDFE